MLKLLKTYIPMIISILFFFAYASLLRIMFENITKEVSPTSFSLMIFVFVVIVIFIIEMVYFIIKAATNKKIENRALWAVLVYLFNVFIIPYYNFKYEVKTKKVKLNMTIYIILSILAIIMGIIIPGYIFESEEQNESEIYNLYLHQSDVEFKFKGNYVKREMDGYDLYASDFNRQINVGIFIYDDEYDVDAEEIQKFQNDWIKEARDNVKLLESYSKDLDDRIIISDIHSGVYEGDTFIYKISTIEFKECDHVINTVMVTFEEDYELYKDELDQILLDATVINN